MAEIVSLGYCRRGAAAPAPGAQTWSLPGGIRGGRTGWRGPEHPARPRVASSHGAGLGAVARRATGVVHYGFHAVFSGWSEHSIGPQNPLHDGIYFPSPILPPALE